MKSWQTEQKVSGMDNFAMIKSEVDCNKAFFNFGKDVYVQKWIVSEPVEVKYSSFANFDGFQEQDECLPLLFGETPCGKDLSNLAWSFYHEDTTFLTHLGGINDETLLISTAFCVVSEKRSRATVHLYSKGNLKIWQNGALVYMGKNNIKNMDDTFIIEISEGRNYFFVEKLALSISIKILEYNRDVAIMSKYLSEEFICFYEKDLNIVVEAYVVEKPKFMVIVLPRDVSSKRERNFFLKISKDDLQLANIVAVLGRKIEISLGVGAYGRLRIDAFTSDGILKGSDCIYVGDPEQQILTYRERLENNLKLSPQEKNDLLCLLNEVQDIYTLQESTLYESRMTCFEDVRAFIDSVDYLDKTLSASEQGQPCEHDKRKGLIVNSYHSSLDDNLQYYYAYIPPYYDSCKKYRVLVLLKFLYKKVQLPGFLFNGLKDVAPEYDVIILSPFGRGVNRYEVAGEVDLLEAINDLTERYNIDKRQIHLAGFSMGGGACWNLAQKFPHLFRGIITFSSNLNPRFNVNLGNTNIVYISGTLDKMFDHEGNHKKIRTFLTNESGTHGYSNFLEDTSHFSLITIYHDIRMMDWVTNLKNKEIPESIHFMTDNLLYNTSYWLCIEDVLDPSQVAEVKADIYKDKIIVRSNNIKTFSIQSEILSRCRIRSISVNGRVILIENAKHDRLYIQAENDPHICNGLPLAGHNRCMAGIVEIYYDRLSIVACTPTKERDAKFVNKMSRSFSRPVYYENFRERYAEIPVYTNFSPLPEKAYRGNLLIIGEEHDDLVRDIINKGNVKKKVARLKQITKEEPFLLLFKLPSIYREGKLIVLFLYYNLDGMNFKGLALLRAKFSPPFTDSKELLANDAVLLTDGGVYGIQFNSSWDIIGFTKFQE